MKFVRVMLLVVGLSGAIASTGAVLVLSGYAEQWLPRSSGALIRYALLRLEGHSKLETVANPVLYAALRQVERPVDQLLLPSLGKGQSPRGMPPTTIQVGLPQLVATEDEFQRALSIAQAGAVIELGPGRYRFSRNLRVRHGGTEQQPITVRARAPGQVVLEFAQLEGFVIDKPHWTFENLHIRGACQAMHDCEHAFHIVGNAHHVRLVNLLIEDFNAHIKINGQGGAWPDHGLLAHSTLRNQAVRQTTRPVTPFDLVGASHWQVLDNLVVHSVHADRKRPSYGMFMKGGGEGGLFARNVVICSSADISRAGNRVGISFGGGTTGAGSCRNDGCAAYEHTRGLAANNVIAHCNDVGLDVNRSIDIVLAHNTLINTAGILTRGRMASAHAYGNVVEGAIRARDGTAITIEKNTTGVIKSALRDADQLDVRFAGAPKAIARWGKVTADFCDAKRKDPTAPGALETDSKCW